MCLPYQRYQRLIKKEKTVTKARKFPDHRNHPPLQSLRGKLHTQQPAFKQQPSRPSLPAVNNMITRLCTCAPLQSQPSHRSHTIAHRIFQPKSHPPPTFSRPLSNPTGYYYCILYYYEDSPPSYTRVYKYTPAERVSFSRPAS